MSKNIAVAPSTSASAVTVAADEVTDTSLAASGNVLTQYIKLMDGTVAGTNKLTITSGGAAKVDGSATTQPISVVSLPLPSGAATLAGQQAAQGTFGSITGNKMVLYDSSGVAVDYTAASPVTQSGTWTVQIGNTANTTAIKVDGSAVTQPVSGTVSITDISNAEYETVAASQTDQALGATGGTGDYLAGVLIVPATTAAGAVSIKDGSGSSISLFAGGGTTALTTLIPFFVPLGIKSTGGAWKVTTGSNVSAIGVGNFT